MTAAVFMHNCLFALLICVTSFFVCGGLTFPSVVAQHTNIGTWSSTSCTNISTNITYPEGGGDLYATDCTYAGFVWLSNSNGYSGSGTVALTLEGGSVWSKRTNGIGIQAYDSITYEGQRPLLVAIKGISFGQDCIVRFVGYLSPGSSVAISNNSFSMTSKNTNAGTGTLAGSDVLAAIVLGRPIDEFILTRNVGFNVVNNTIISITQSSLSVVPVAFQGTSLSISNNATLAIEDNILKNSVSNGEVSVISWVGISGTGLIISLNNQSILSLSGNKAVNVSSSMGLKVLSFYVDPAVSELYLMATNASMVRMERNEIINCTIYNEAAVVHTKATQLYVPLTDHSSFVLSSNAIKDSKTAGTATVISWSVDDNLFVLLTNSSQVSISTNTVSGIITPKNVYAVQISSAGAVLFSTSSNSVVSVYENMITNVSIAQGCVLFVSSGGTISFNVYGNSTLHVASNILQGSTGINLVGVYILVRISFFRLNVNRSSRVLVSGNKVCDSIATNIYGVRLSQSLEDGIFIDIDSQSVVSLSSNRLENVTTTSATSQLIALAVLTDGMGSIAITAARQSFVSMTGNGVSSAHANSSVSALLIKSTSGATIVSLESSTFEATSNVVEQSFIGASAFAFVLAGWQLTLTVSNSSSLIARSNRVASASMTGCSVVQFMSSFFYIDIIVSSSSNVDLSGNAASDLTARNNSSLINVVQIISDAQMNIIVSRGSNFSTSSNTIGNATNFGRITAVLLTSNYGSLTLEQSCFVLNGNKIYDIGAASAVAVLVKATSVFSLMVTSESTISASNNSVLNSVIIVSAFGVRIFPQSSSLNASAGSTVQFLGNKLVNLRKANLVAGLRIDALTLCILENASLVVSSTEIWNATAVTSLSAVDIMFVGNSSLQASSAVTLSDNSVLNSRAEAIAVVSLTLNDMSVFASELRVSNNTLLLMESTTAINVSLIQFLTSPEGVGTLQIKGKLVIDGNSFTAPNLNASLSRLMTFDAPVLLPHGSLSVQNNKMSIVSIDGIVSGILFSKNFQFLSGISEVLVLNNSFQITSTQSGSVDCAPVVVFTGLRGQGVSPRKRFIITDNFIQRSTTFICPVMSLGTINAPYSLLSVYKNTVSLNRWGSFIQVGLQLRTNSVVIHENGITVSSIQSVRGSFMLMEISSLSWESQNFINVTNNIIRSETGLKNAFSLVSADQMPLFNFSAYCTLNLCGNSLLGYRIEQPSLFVSPSEKLKAFLAICPHTQTLSHYPGSSTLSLLATLSAGKNSRSLSHPPPKTVSIVASVSGGYTKTVQNFVSHSTVLLDPGDKPPVIPRPVPAATTASLTVVASAIGGATAAVDAQTMAVIGLVSCAGGQKSKSNRNYRSLSIVALDDTCEGVLIGNTIVVLAAAFLSAVGVSVTKIILSKRHLKAVSDSKIQGQPVPVPPTLAVACGMARAPHLWLSLSLYLMNSFAVCGIELARGDGSQGKKGGAGVAFAVPLLLVLSFPVMTYLFGSRRLLPVRYLWRPKPLSVVGSTVFQSWALDPDVGSDKLFGCVFGGMRRLGCLWPLVPQISFVATLPVILATTESDNCGPMFTLSAVLYFVGALFVLALRPRRVLASDLLHCATLIVNGLTTSMAALLLATPGDASATLTLDHLGTAMTVLTAIRISHSVAMILLGVLVRLGKVSGVAVEEADDVSVIPSSHSCCQIGNIGLRYEGLWWPLRSSFNVKSLQNTSIVGDQSNPLLEGLLAVTEMMPYPETTTTEQPWTDTGSYQVDLKPTGGSLLSSRLAEYNRFQYDEQSEDAYLSEDALFRRELAKDLARRDISNLTEERR